MIPSATSSTCTMFSPSSGKALAGILPVLACSIIWPTSAWSPGP